ncbi:MAG: thermonuclease family protein [Deltaproteobacteria bacterium]|nr:thermonuclease family protein [Deltaproteobacteria bacterium]MBN2671400.1 thermonuclease family protein [Deltaproteobacteria bacterium]
MASNNSNNIPPNNYQALLSNICNLYDQVLKRGKTQNKRVLDAYWHIGKTVLQVTEGRDHTYGKKIIAHLSNDMTQKYGEGFGERTVRYLRKFARSYALSALNPTLSWSHYRVLLSVSNPQTRQQLEQAAIEETLTKEDLQKRTTALRKSTEASLNNEFPLVPRNARPNIYKIADAGSTNTSCMVDLGFNIIRRMSVPGIENPTSGMYITQSSSRRFKEVLIQPGERYCYESTPVRVIDGDTVKLRLHLGFDMFVHETMRLRGVDAMELGTPKGQSAHHALTQLLTKHPTLHALTYHHDKYGRYITDLIADNRIYINKQLVETGHARFLKM